MKQAQHKTFTGNEAAAHIAYRLNEVLPIYPITPATCMSELVEKWNAQGMPNIFQNETQVSTLQSEAGVAGALHGALQTGSLATTFTASQGLLLMIPNMYKMAGQLLPHVIHVATRSIATHALSVFGDHSDIMAVRNTGYAFLGAASVQEVMDFALISQAASLRSRIPFVHFFDGFRTSHEYNSVRVIPDEIIKSMIPSEALRAHRERALNPNHPVIRGTAQGADVFFQSREAINPYYDACAEIVQQTMDQFASLTGRSYKLFEYSGHPEAEHVIVVMGSAVSTAEQTINQLNEQGEKCGLLKVRLFRPFNAESLIKALPVTTQKIAVLDRCKEPGAQGEPLFNDIFMAIHKNTKHFESLPQVFGGRYGLSSKEFTPAMVQAVLENLKQPEPKKEFTVGIEDDLTFLSLDHRSDESYLLKAEQALIIDVNESVSCDSFKNLVQLLSEDEYVQAYSEIGYGKSRSVRPSHLRHGNHPIEAPYLISDANFLCCALEQLILRPDLVQNLALGGQLLVHSTKSKEEVINELPKSIFPELKKKQSKLYLVNLTHLKDVYKVGEYQVSGFHACYLAMNSRLLESFGLFQVLLHIDEIKQEEMDFSNREPLSSAIASSSNITKLMISGRGDSIPVSSFPVDGTYASNTSEQNTSRQPNSIPEWNADLCIQCGACSMACTQAALRIKVFDLDNDDFLPDEFQYADALDTKWASELMKYTIQVNPDQCSACKVCVDACPENALTNTPASPIIERTKEYWNFFQTLPEMDRSRIDVNKVSDQQLQEPLFKYADVKEGCGEAPYLKLLSQLFGDRALIANATGASSIFGGALPTTPWSVNWEGRGPAWANSLYEDNAEFGLGFRISLDQKKKRAISLLETYDHGLNEQLKSEILNAKQLTDSDIAKQRLRVKQLKMNLESEKSPLAKELYHHADSLVKNSVWIVGGDGWAYDIGFGGLDHVLASGANVNILVLDNELYDNTGGQRSKATPFGASAAFAYNGKRSMKKDLGKLAMQYKDVYVASVAIGANQEQTLRAFNEAEAFDGPSIILAYCHSDAHGIDMKAPSQYHKAAVDSGSWLLYRFDPRRVQFGLKPLQLDCSAHSISVETYMRMEQRFDRFLSSERNDTKQLLEQLQHNIYSRYEEYKRISAANDLQSEFIEPELIHR